MAQDHYNEFISKGFIGLSLILSLIFWGVFTWLLVPFVPAETPVYQYGLAAFTAASLTGVFYVATHMFQLVLQEQRKARQARDS